jgi:mannan endo-1,4-beta-mannosidase
MNKARLAAVLIAGFSVTMTATGAGAELWAFRHQPSSGGHQPPVQQPRTVVLPAASSAPFPRPAITNPGALSYLGVAERSTPSSYQPVTNFTSIAGRKPNMTVYYSPWGASFRGRFVTAAARTGAVVVVQLQPWHVSAASIAAGGSDRYLTQLADQIRRYGGPVILSFAAEANGRWYPWGWRHQKPAHIIAAWRHVVTLFRNLDAVNVTWLWDVSGQHGATGKVRRWWPGARYVDWVGIDGYYFTRADSYRSVIGATVRDVRKFTTKPILLSEVGIGPKAGQVAKLPGLFAGIRRDRLLGLIWFNVQQHQGLYHQDWRLRKPAAIAAFRAGVSSLGQPRA